MPDWSKLIDLIAPAVGSVAAGGDGHGAAFWQGYQQQHGQLEQERQRKAREDQAKAVAGSQFLIHSAEQLQGIEDPVQFDEMLRLYEDAGTKAGYVKPGELKGRVAFPQSKVAQARLKEIDTQLGTLEKNGYDVDQLATSGSRLTLKDGSTVPIASALDLTRRRPLDPSGAPVPKPRKASELPNAGSFEDYVGRFAKEAGKPIDALTAADIQEARKRYQQADNPPEKPPKSPDRSFVEAQLDDLLDVWKASHPGKEPTAADRVIMRQEAQKQIGRADERPLAPTGPPGTLPPRTQTRVDAKSRGFDSLPIVKTIQKQAEAVSFSEGMNPNTTNPADDQALIYAFAKAMDPDSVVREGEYATVQKYAQSWASTFGFTAARIFSNTAFLTPQARANMKQTIRAKYQAGLSQYQNVRGSYAKQINKITGTQDGEDWLTDYSAGFPSDSSSTGTNPAAAAKSAREKLNRRR